MSGVQEFLWPECTWDGADQPLRPSQVGRVATRVSHLWDPVVFVEGGAVYPAYMIAGEAGLALARLNGEV